MIARVLTAMVALLTGMGANGQQAERRLTVDDGLPSNTVRSIVQDGQGFLWMGTDNGLCRYDGTGVRAYRIAQNGSRQYIASLRAAGDSLVVGTETGLFSFHPRTERFRRLGRADEPHPGRGDQLTTHDGRRWEGTWEDGLRVTAPGGHTETVLSPARQGLGYHIHRLYEYSPHELLIGCDEGLIGYDTATGEARRWDTPKFVYAIERDREGGLWIGTFYDGVCYLNTAARRFEAVPGHVIARFCEDAQGRLWVASDDAGLTCLSGGQPQDYPGRSTLERQNVHALLSDGADGQTLWVGTYSDGIYRLGGNAVRHYTTADGLADNSSYVMLRDAGGQLWAGTMGAICRYDAANDRFQPVRRTEALPISMATDRQGRLWVATQGDGLHAWDGRRWRHYRHEADTASLADDQVNGLLTARDGQLWVATQGGLCRYDAAYDRFQRLTTVAAASVVEAAGTDELWIATSRGVMKFSPTAGAQGTFTREDGLIGLQFQPAAGYRDSRGFIYFGTASGYSRFRPELIETNHVAPPVYITGLEIFNRPVSVGETRLPVQPAALDELRLSYSDRMFSLTYAALSFVSPVKNEYAYRLDGFDTDWNTVGSQTKATYTNLPPGNYTFRVKATNNDGLWTDHEATLRITVSPPFWLTWWAKTAYALLAVAALWWLMRVRLKRAEHRRHREELHRIAEIASNPTDNEFLVRMNRIIEENYANAELNVQFLAEQLAVSRSSLFAKTKALADVTPNEMIQMVRLKRAADLLREGGHTVSEVCYAVGFSSPSYFSKCFQKQFGIKPGDFIRK